MLLDFEKEIDKKLHIFSQKQESKGRKLQEIKKLLS